MKTEKLMNTLSVENLKEISGGVQVTKMDFHIHCIQPEPGTCSCSPAKSFAKHEYI